MAEERRKDPKVSFEGVLQRRQYKAGQGYVQLVFLTAEGQKLAVSSNLLLVCALVIGSAYKVTGRLQSAKDRQYVTNLHIEPYEMPVQTAQPRRKLVVGFALCLLVGLGIAGFCMHGQTKQLSSSRTTHIVRPAAKAPTTQTQPATNASATTQAAGTNVSAVTSPTPTPASKPKPVTKTPRPAPAVTQQVASPQTPSGNTTDTSQQLASNDTTNTPASQPTSGDTTGTSTTGDATNTGQSTDTNGNTTTTDPGTTDPTTDNPPAQTPPQP